MANEITPKGVTELAALAGMLATAIGSWVYSVKSANNERLRVTQLASRVDSIGTELQSIRIESLEKQIESTAVVTKIEANSEGITQSLRRLEDALSAQRVDVQNTNKRITRIAENFEKLSGNNDR